MQCRLQVLTPKMEAICQFSQTDKELNRFLTFREQKEGSMRTCLATPLKSTKFLSDSVRNTVKMRCLTTILCQINRRSPLTCWRRQMKSLTPSTDNWMPQNSLISNSCRPSTQNRLFQLLSSCSACKISLNCRNRMRMTTMEMVKRVASDWKCRATRIKSSNSLRRCLIFRRMRIGIWSGLVNSLSL